MFATHLYRIYSSGWNPQIKCPIFCRQNGQFFFDRFYSIRILFYFYRRGREGCYKIEIELKIEVGDLDIDFTDFNLSLGIYDVYNQE